MSLPRARRAGGVLPALALSGLLAVLSVGRGPAQEESASAPADTAAGATTA